MSTPPATTPPAHVRTVTLEDLALEVTRLHQLVAGDDQLRRDLTHLFAAQTTTAGAVARQGSMIAELLEGQRLLLAHFKLELPRQNVQATVPA